MWSLENYPDEMYALMPDVRVRAIEIANALALRALEEHKRFDMDRIIAVAIVRARDLYEGMNGTAAK